MKFNDFSESRPYDHRGLRQELAHETNNLAVYINGKLWKVWAGKGYADSHEERAYLNSMQAWADRKSAATGKKWTVGLTGAEITESNVKEVVSPMSFNDDDWYEINTETKTIVNQSGPGAYRLPAGQRQITLPNGNIVVRGMRAKYMDLKPQGVAESLPAPTGKDPVRYSKMLAAKKAKAKEVFLKRKAKVQDKDKQTDLNEFAPPGSSDGGNDGFSEDTLKRLAAQWWNGDEDPRVEQTLMSAGWEIGQDEGYDNGGAFVVQAGDINGNSYISWPAEELEGLSEGNLEEIDRRGFLKGAGAAALAGAAGSAAGFSYQLDSDDYKLLLLGECLIAGELSNRGSQAAVKSALNQIYGFMNYPPSHIESQINKQKDWLSSNPATYQKLSRLFSSQENVINLLNSIERLKDKMITTMTKDEQQSHINRLGIKERAEQGVAEDYNGEYDDEAGMADNNLETLKRAVQGIDDVISAGDNLPEWCQEKIAISKSMLVAVWDYMRSEEESEEDPEIAEMYEAMQDLAEEIAVRDRVNIDLVWESFESLPDNMLYETAAWRRKEGKSAKGGLNAKGVASYRRENPGSKLQTAVTTKPSKLKPGSKAAKRRKSFCARMSGVKGPMKKPNGKPTRKALALRKWNC